MSCQILKGRVRVFYAFKDWEQKLLCWNSILLLPSWEVPEDTDSSRVNGGYPFFFIFADPFLTLLTRDLHSPIFVRVLPPYLHRTTRFAFCQCVSVLVYVPDCLVFCLYICTYLSVVLDRHSVCLPPIYPSFYLSTSIHIYACLSLHLAGVQLVWLSVCRSLAKFFLVTDAFL